MKLVLTSALFGALFLISGCGTQCESVCAEYNTCQIDSDPPERFVHVDCANFCAGVDAANARSAQAGTAGCAQKWSAHMTCWQQNRTKICDNDPDTGGGSATDCDASAGEWEACIGAYCATLGADEYDPACFDGDIAFLSPFQSGF